MSSSPVITRYAPSPTGFLHVGGARTALFSWLLARHHGGRFLLRIEDTDLARSSEAAAGRILDDLRWLGLNWDNAQLMYQSKRTDLYNSIITGLIERGLAYKAWETPEELDALRKEAERQKRTFVYRRPPLTDAQLRQYESSGRPHVVRLAMPVKEHRFEDAVLRKPIVVAAEQVQDFIIRKTDGMPTFHFAVVVDDAEMGVTHVLRGQEHLLNTVNHIALQEALGYTRPIYGHLPVILNTDGSKMSKRDRDRKLRQSAKVWLNSRRLPPAQLAAAAGLQTERLAEWLDADGVQLDAAEQSAVMHAIGLKQSDLPEIMVEDFRRNGYLPEALLNFLALLGWNPGGDRERMTMQELIELFSIDDIGKGNARFDRAKLAAFNTDTCAAAAPDRLVKAFRDFLAVNPDSPLAGADDEALAKLIRIKPGFRTLREIEEVSRFFFIADDQVVYDPAAVEKILRKQGGAAVLAELPPLLESITSWRADALEDAIKRYAEQKQLGLGKVAQPLRVAISGTTVSPPIFQSLEFLGRDRTLARIDRCLAAV